MGQEGGSLKSSGYADWRSSSVLVDGEEETEKHLVGEVEEEIGG
jgi:hypothetical protein